MKKTYTNSPKTNHKATPPASRSESSKDAFRAKRVSLPANPDSQARSSNFPPKKDDFSETSAPKERPEASPAKRNSSLEESSSKERLIASSAKRDDFFNLSIRDFALLTGATRDTLRYYYEQKLIIPYVDPDNGYHYYSIAQASSFFYINRLRALGYSVADIRELINSIDLSLYQKKVAEKEEEIEASILKIQHDLQTIRQIKWLTSRMSGYVASTGRDLTPHRGSAPMLPIPVRRTAMEELSILRTPIHAPSHAWSMSDVSSDIKRHIHTFSPNGTAPSTGGEYCELPMGATIAKDSLLSGSYHYQDIFSIALGTKKEGRIGDTIIEALPSRDVLECIVSENDARNAGYEALVQFMHENNLTPVSDLYILSLFNLYGKDDIHSYLKYMFICVS